jgi:hypothetical protein
MLGLVAMEEARSNNTSQASADIIAKENSIWRFTDSSQLSCSCNVEVQTFQYTGYQDWWVPTGSPEVISPYENLMQDLQEYIDHYENEYTTI